MKGDKGAPAAPRLSLWGPLSLSLIEPPLGWLRQHFQSSSRKDAELLCRLNHALGFCIKTRGPWRLAAHLANFFGADPQPSGRQQEKHMAQAVSWAPAHLSPSVGWLLGPPLQRSPVWNVPGSRLEQECPHFTSACLWWESSHRKKKPDGGVSSHCSQWKGRCESDWGRGPDRGNAGYESSHRVPVKEKWAQVQPARSRSATRKKQQL